MPNSPQRIIVLLPTYNEASNVEAMLAAILRVHSTLEVLVIDDMSPDGTAGLVKNVQRTEPRVRLMERQGPRGLANAYKDGMRWAVENGYDAIQQMDCDFSHDPKDVPRLIEQLEKTDVAIGSRYVEGGGLDGWPWYRNFISSCGNVYARLTMGMRVRDLTSGFVCWRRDALAAVIAEKIAVRGYSFQILMKFLAIRKGFTLGEVPIVFHDRTSGKSKMSFSITSEAMLKVPAMKFMQLWRERRSFFAMVAVLLVSIPLVELIVPQPQDVRTCFNWLGMAYDNGFFNVYSGDQQLVAARLGDYAPGYPPLTFWFYYPIYALMRLLGWSGQWPSHLANLLYRLPLFAGLACAAMGVGRLAVAPPKSPRFAWLSIGANPALILAGPLWGQFETVQWLFCFAGIGFLFRGQAMVAGFWLAVAFLLKPQFIFFVPVLVALALRHVRLRQWKSLASFAAVVFALTLPFMLASGMNWFTWGYGRLTDPQDKMTITAFNLWWLTGRFLGWIRSAEPMLGIPLKFWALGLSAAVSGGLWLRFVWGERRPSLVPVAAAYFTSLYAFLPHMSARFLTFGLLWTLVWAIEERKARVAAALLSGSLITALLFNPFFVPESRFYGILPKSFATVLATMASLSAVGVSVWMVWRCSRAAECRGVESLVGENPHPPPVEEQRPLRYVS